MHRSAAKKLAAARAHEHRHRVAARLRAELNPVEPRWSHAKFGKLANFVPHDTRQLARAVMTSLNGQIDSTTTNKCSFFHTAQLKPINQPFTAQPSIGSPWVEGGQGCRNRPDRHLAGRF